MKTGAMLVAVGLLAVAGTGCGSSKPALSDADQTTARDDTIKALRAQVQETEAARKAAEKQAQKAQGEATRARAAAESAKAAATSSGSVNPADYMLPADAKTGECYARVLIPPVFSTSSEQVLIRSASEKINIVPADYEWGSESVLVKESSERLEVVPATYEWIEERVMVKPPRAELRVVPAEYETVTEKILVTPARTYWKKGRGPIEKVDNATGEIMCLVKEPAVYKQVATKVLKKPETVREIEIPAEYTSVKKMVLKTPPSTKKITIPAKHESVKVLKQVRPADETKTVVPAEYRTVPTREMVEPSRVEWQPVLCETNISNDLVRELQRALQAKGHTPGPIDGIYGPLTQNAVRSYQKAGKLATGGLTYETLRALKISM